MPNDASNSGFRSVLAPFMEQFFQEMHACGYANGRRDKLPFMSTPLTPIFEHFVDFLVEKASPREILAFQIPEEPAAPSGWP
jgi:hypothetical protein